MSPRTRSASVSARPQVGSAGHAIAQRERGAQRLRLRPTPWAASSASISRPVVLGHVAQQHVLLRRHHRVHAEARRPPACSAVRSRKVPASSIRPDGHGHAEPPAPVALRVPAQQLRAPRASASPAGRPAARRNRSRATPAPRATPMSSTTYFSRARRRSARLPWSRCKAITALGGAQQVVRSRPSPPRSRAAG